MPTQTTDPRPNIIFIITDQQRFDTIRALGFDYMDTPNMDRLVEEGVTLLVAVIPWSVAGAFYSATLGISVIEYAPFALFNLLNPIIAIVLAYLGVAIIKSKSQQS